MYKIIVICIFCLALFQGKNAIAEIPPDIMAEYTSYSNSLKEQDYKAALKHAKNAWEKAEDELGDSLITGDLAYNYGYLAGRLGKMLDAVEPLKRSADLAHFAPQDGALIRLEREVELATVMLAANKKEKAWKRLNEARKFAGANDIDDSIFAAELMVNQARIIANNANRVAKYSMNNLSTHIDRDRRTGKVQSKSAQFANDALAIFLSKPQEARKTYIAMAYKLIGFSHERNKEWKEALLAYQKTMEIQKTYSDIDDRPYITTIGRWMNVRTHFMHGIDYEEAYQQGMCKCWPYEKESTIRAVSIKRVAPVMPRKAMTSGFSIVRLDLDDEGNVINPEILQSWPEKVYDRSSLIAIKKWKYESKADGQQGAQRTGIIITMKYILTDYMGRDPI